MKRSSRAAAKTASGKMKESSAARRWNKKVDRTLYGSREYASKNPSLSPITERLSFVLSFNSEEPLPETSSAPGQEPQPDLRCNGNSVSGDPATSAVAPTGDMTALNASTAPQASLSLPPGAKHGDARRTRRLSGSKLTGRALKGRKVSVNDERAEGRHERSEEGAALNNAIQEEAEEVNLKEIVDEGSGVVANLLQDVNKELESQSTSLSVDEETKRALGEVESSQETQPDDKMNHIEKDHEENIPPSSEAQQEAAPKAAQLTLAPWQDDFNFEDVFKPAPTRGQRSVRRSLRNKSSIDPSDGGTVWLPHTSPETIKESRRRTRGRRLSAALPTLPFEEGLS